MLIEDDIQVLRQLNKIISGIRNDFDVVAAFTHPDDAIDFLYKNTVDAIITDIQLPKMTGIELCSYCHKHFPNVKFAILSAYDYFEYAQKAIDLEVVHYVLKPITISKLEVLLNKLSERISRADESEGFVTTIVNLNRQQTIMNLLSNFYENYDDFFADMKKNDVELTRDNCKCANLSIVLNGLFDVLEEKPTHSKEELYQIVSKIVARNNTVIYSILFNTSINNITVFIFSKTKNNTESFKETVSEYVIEITKDVKNILNTEVLIKSLDYFENIDDFCKAMRKNYTCEEQAKNIISQIYDNDFDAAIRCLEAVKMIFDENQAKIVYNYILSHLPGFSEKDFSQENFSGEKLLDIIISQINHLKHTALSSNSKEDVIQKACRYINDNFAKDITLNDVAKHVFLNPIYFSSYFKKMTGEKYSDYLTNVKIQKARQLLCDTDIKIPVVAEMSGFRDTNYFYKIFKNSTGLTPLEYRKKFRGKN